MFSNGYDIMMPYGFLTRFRETGSHSRIHGGCHVSTSGSERDKIGELIFEKTFIKAATLLSDKIEIVGRKLSKSIGSEMVIQ